MKNLIGRLVTPEMWKIFGDFKAEKGEFNADGNKSTYETDKFLIKTEYREDSRGVFRLCGTLTAKDDITLRNLDLRMNLGGGENED